MSHHHKSDHHHRDSSSHRHSRNDPRPTTAAGLAKSMQTLSLENRAGSSRKINSQPLSVKFYGYFLGSKLKTSYMSSYASSSQPSTSGSFISADAFGVKFRLTTNTTFQQPRSNTVLGIIDSAFSYLLADRSLFNAVELQQAAVADGSTSNSSFQLTFGAPLTGSRHKGIVTVDQVKVYDQIFAACDPSSVLSGQFRVLLGLGPKNGVPELLYNIVQQNPGLSYILGISVRSWAETTGSTDVQSAPLRGRLDFGGFDPTVCNESNIVRIPRSANPVVAIYYGLSVELSYGDLRSSNPLMPLHSNQNQTRVLPGMVPGMLDTGEPGIGLSARMFEAWCYELTRNDIRYEIVRHASGNAFVQIHPEDESKLDKNLILKFEKVGGGTHKVKISPRRLKFPDSLARAYFSGLNSGWIVLTTLCVSSVHDVTLGVTFHQGRYIFIDMNQWPYQYGLVETEATSTKATKKASEKEKKSVGGGKQVKRSSREESPHKKKKIRS